MCSHGNRPIFICFRQDDGKVTAERIYHLLSDQPVPSPSDTVSETEPSHFDIHFERAIPDDSDWGAVHESQLGLSRTLIVVCSPGIKHPVDDDDWAHRDIEWWLENRDQAPILVDPLGTELRWVPQSIVEKWPDIQPIRMIEDEWEGLTAAELSSLEGRTREQLLDAIVSDVEAHEAEQSRDRLQDLESSLDEQRQLAEQLQASLPISRKSRRSCGRLSIPGNRFHRIFTHHSADRKHG